MFKKLSIFTLLIILMNFFIYPLSTTNAINNTEVEKYTYETIVNNKGPFKNWEFKILLTVPDTEHIHIDINCLKAPKNYCGVVGNIQIPDGIIPIGEDINNKTSAFASVNGCTKYTTEYIDSNIIYTLICSTGEESLQDTTLAHFDLYTTSQLNNDIEIVVLGDKITIPKEYLTVKLQANSFAYELGDVNGDGSVDGSDAGMVLNEFAIIGAEQPSTFDDLQRVAGDVNEDGSIDGTDAALILRYYAQESISL